MAGPDYRYEYVSAAVPMGPITSGTEWSLEVLLANRGETTEHFQVTFRQGDGNFETFVMDDKAVEPLRVGGVGFADETDPGFTVWDLLWVTILVTSQNLVPTMRFDVQGEDTPPPEPEYFFGPGDFAVFPVRPHLDPPIGGGPTNPVEG